MIRLTREIRASWQTEVSKNDPLLSVPVGNSWAGWPPATAILPWLKFQCTLEGEPDSQTGYLCNIKVIDDAFRDRVLCQSHRFAESTYESLLQFAFQQVQAAFPEHCRIFKIKLVATPALQYSIQPNSSPMIQLSQQFEFSASHRLHHPGLSDEENIRLFGKCNNPHGHGHNYVVTITLCGDVQQDGVVIPLPQLEGLVKSHVIDVLDHKNLNVEVAQFRETNPSVENIARAIWEILDPIIAELPDRNAQLSRVRVHETAKTWADYFG